MAVLRLVDDKRNWQNNNKTTNKKQNMKKNKNKKIKKREYQDEMVLCPKKEEE